MQKNFDHQNREPILYNHWVEQGYFYSKADHREPYTVVIPPPNVTGILHMGHCLNNTIQDILIRRARQDGKNACWVPGTDHASIATEAKVVQMLREKNIAKSSLSRDAFLTYAWEWKEKYGGIILQQLRKLGCSLDWNRVNFTMDPDYYNSVIQVFVDLHKKGLIYRGKRMINWDPKAKTALSDEEVIFKETNSKLYHLAYPVVDKDGQSLHTTITIATVRPETILGDTAIAVHPLDERYLHLQGAFALVPLINRKIPIIADDYVAMDFGTGALKVTPAHDMNDNQLGAKHQLEVIDIMNDDGSFSEAAQLFVGEDRFVARKKIIPLLEEGGFLVKTEDYKNQVGYSERSDAVVEPRLSLQWWVKMEPLAQKALQVVNDGEINFHPAKFKNLYRHWMENIKDWCISRQLWWGHRIPAWYDDAGNVYVAQTKTQALELAVEKTGLHIDNIILTQDEDCLDTWFSSWLWPFEVFKGLSHPGNQDIKYYYPTATLVTAPEIIFFWVARMIMAGLEYEGTIPFKDVYFTGIVRDEKGRKMSKSLGNSPDLLQLIDKYGADAVRFGILISSPAGNDLLFDVKEESTLKQGSFFVNKIWNALRLIKTWEEKGLAQTTPTSHPFANDWMEARLQQASAELAELMQHFKLSEALKLVYSLIWDDFCSWYLEWVKPDFDTQISSSQYHRVIDFFEELITLLHPFMPFITEEVYQQLRTRATGSDLTLRTLNPPVDATQNRVILEQGELLKKLISAVRDSRNKLQLSPKITLSCGIQSPTGSTIEYFKPILEKQANIQLTLVTQPVEGATVSTLDIHKIYLESQVELDPTVQKESLLKDLAQQQKFKQSIAAKLNNERFVQNAKPEVVALEQKKMADTEARIQAIEESLASMQ